MTTTIVSTRIINTIAVIGYDCGKRYYFVDATNGADGNNGLSEATAWKTINRVNVQTFIPGDYIAFKRGETFAGEIHPTDSGDSEDYIYYGAYGSGARPIVDGSAKSGFYVSGDSYSYDQTYIWVESIDFKGSGNPVGDYLGAVIANNPYLYFYDCIFREAAYGFGIQCWGGNTNYIHHIVVDACIAHHNQLTGINFGADGTYGPHDCEIKNCTAYQNGVNMYRDHGIYVRHGVSVHDNTCYQNFSAGIKLNAEGYHSAYSPECYNNILYDNYIGLYAVNQGSSIYNNYMYSNQYNMLLDPDSHDMDIIHNTFVNADNVPGYTNLYITANVANNTLKNNVFIQDWSISARYIMRGNSTGTMQYFAANNDIDYNLYYENNNMHEIMFYNEGNGNSWDFAAWQALPGNPDANSTLLLTTPDINSNDYTDVRPLVGGNMDGLGVYIAGYATDINGLARTNPPTQGAYATVIGVPPGVIHLVTTGTSLVDGYGAYSDVDPGDIIELQPGNRGQLTIRNISGTLANPIVIRNGNGVVNTTSGEMAYYFQNCHYVQITGTGYGQTYGIRISSTSNFGILFQYKTDNIEIDHIEALNIGGQGIAIHGYTTSLMGDYDYNNDGIDDYPTINRATYAFDHVSIHDCHIDGGAGIYSIQVAMYIGLSEYRSNPNEPAGNDCEIYNNIIENTYHKALQVGSWVSELKVHDNTVLNACMVTPDEGIAININPGVGGEVYNNWVQNAYGAGIYDQTAGCKIYNNVIIDCGRNQGTYGSGIVVDYPAGYSHSQNLQILNNTIINPLHYGINLVDHYGIITVENNITVNPNYGYINGVPDVESNNLETMNINSVGFVNAAGYDYTLAEGSIAINAGADVSGFGITFDGNNDPRPVGAYDQGAYEHQ